MSDGLQGVQKQGNEAKVYVTDLRKLRSPEATVILMELQRLEDKVFPSTEAFSFGESLRSKPNYQILVARCSAAVVGYAVGVTSQHRMLLHKLCVKSDSRRTGIGELLLNELISRAKLSRCRGVDLWVDESRLPARALYTKLEFVVQEQILDYYGPNRKGIKMFLKLSH